MYLDYTHKVYNENGSYDLVMSNYKAMLRHYHKHQIFTSQSEYLLSK